MRNKIKITEEIGAIAPINNGSFLNGTVKLRYETYLSLNLHNYGIACLFNDYRHFRKWRSW